VLGQIRRFDRGAQLVTSRTDPPWYRLSGPWAKRHGSDRLRLDQAEAWVAWAAQQVADEQTQMQAASRHRLANPVPVADVLKELGQERGAAS
jgi:hypothetical protein